MRVEASGVGARTSFGAAKISLLDGSEVFEDGGVGSCSVLVKLFRYTAVNLGRESLHGEENV